MPCDDGFEDELGAALRHAADGFEPDDRFALVDDGVRRGRRRLARGRAAAVTGSVLAFALVGSAGAYAGGLLDDPDGGGRAPAAAPSSPGGQSAGAVSGQQMVKILKGLLPKGRFSGEEGRGTGSLEGPLAYVVYDDGRGRAAISLSLSRSARPMPSPADDEQVICPDREIVAYDACASETLRSRAQLMVLQGYEYPDRGNGTKDWSATLLTPDGYRVNVSEWNAPAEKDARVSRKQPPLSPDRLRALVTAPAWGVPLKALSGSPEGVQDPAGAPLPQVDGRTIRAVLRSLLPDGVQVVSEGGQKTGWAHLTLDDGKGRTFLEINVQSGMSDVADDRVRGAQQVQTLADGTKVMTSQGPADDGGSGVVRWTADTLRPSGYRVVVAEMNSGSLTGGKATRATPVITMKQLKAISSHAVWLQGRAGRVAAGRAGTVGAVTWRRHSTPPPPW